MSFNRFNIIWETGAICSYLTLAQLKQMDKALEDVATAWGEVIVGWPIVPGKRQLESLTIRLKFYEVRGHKAGEVIAAVRAEDLETMPTLMGPIAYLPYAGTISINRCAIDTMMPPSTGAGNMARVLMHEVGHVLGIGTLWEAKDLIEDHYSDPIFVGRRALREYKALLKASPLASMVAIKGVPIENRGDWGDKWAHWRESVFGPELMTTTSCRALNKPSRVTVASLEDMGYIVNLDGAEPGFVLGWTAEEQPYCEAPFPGNKPFVANCPYTSNSQTHVEQFCNNRTIIKPPRYLPK